ncbi:BRD4-interacting chromatin-remodeling complex-associated protein-like [Hyla sarda]|uniref:BRD4-interacting chromatin-remodeling complex-associated protein-like n=1 Tax=Hyla sarda TaxID=327740 RepID=UPI0024C2ECCE|nr:BRD4-interacting chromatin-remodeling complex-associated protein-like [Hyla sarda]XP_056424151.1 BRD4-interacting chromatin-remodeling complex-associated protein-like [Hyla sarda]XP_056424152.1 BRD4-interacting chromatin-remodeling complex-associated protein-like [Hyla sarda]XP_056424153.1 BRD4-interacting chromatin-remodeling complex-associated protein-like [Hyla sarda]XP_056424154.1 BRD4-interacting chromatin-remodeling complex-associated protein-like [Hyla sarda]XP_056424155.1 BRD4-inter
MDDDDDSGLLDFIGDPQALNYFLHGSGCKPGEELNTDFSASNSNSIFANSSLTDSKSSIKSVQSLADEESTDGLQLSNNIQFFEDELESSSIPDLSEDILQKSLQEANITEQILAEEAYLDASVAASQQFANALHHALSSASLTQVSNTASYSGQTLHPIGVTHMPVGASFASNTLGVQHGFMQPVGIIPSQHIPTSSHSGSGQIHLIGSINNQSPVMTINNPDGSQIILKSGQQAPPSSTSGGVLVQSHTQNGSTMFSSPNVSPAGQQVTVPFSSGNFQTSLPVHNIIIHRGPAPNASKGPINIQPKPMQVGQQMSYSVSNLGMHHHRHQGAHCVPGNSAQSPSMDQQIPITHQRSHKASSQQPGSSIVIHSPLGEAHAHHNQFFIPAGLSINSSSLQHIQAINAQFVQTQSSHLGPHQVPTEHIMLNRNTGGMIRPSQHYSGQMLHSPGTAVQLVSGQTFSSSGGQVFLNHGPSQIVGGQVAQVSPTLLHLSPGQGNKAQGGSTSSGCSNMTTTNRFTVVNPSTVLQGMGPSFQSPGSGDSYGDQQNDRHHPVSNETHLPGSNTKSNSTFCSNTNSKQPFSCSQSQKNILNHHSAGSLMKNQEGQSNTTDHGPVSRHLHHHLSLSKEALMGLQNAEVEGRTVVLKRPATKQHTKEALFLQHMHKEQEHSLLPDRSGFKSLDNACERLFPYHVFQGSLPSEEDLHQVDNEFETAATHLLKKTQAMLNKYRLLLLDDAMRIEPSAEMVMLDRMFNQEERAMLTREKRMALVDPDAYLTEFCCINKFQESSTDEKVLSSQDMDADADPSSPDACPTVNDSDEDKTDVGKVHDEPFSVPKNNSPSHKPNDTSKDKDSLNTDSMLKNTSLLPQKQLFVSLYKLKRKYTECSSDPDASCETSEKPDSVANSSSPIPVSDSNRDAGDVERPQGKTAGPSQDAACKPRDVAASPGKPFKTSMPSEAVKATVRNVLELKLSAKHFKSETSSSDSAELQFVKPSAPTLEENCVDKPISEAREGAAETDLVLEAAVNSILEC